MISYYGINDKLEDFFQTHEKFLKNCDLYVQNIFEFFFFSNTGIVRAVITIFQGEGWGDR